MPKYTLLMAVEIEAPDLATAERAADEACLDGLHVSCALADVHVTRYAVQTAPREADW